MKYILIIALFIISSLGSAQSYPEKFTAIEGWTVEGEKQFFSRANLYDYINGASDFYLGYDFQDLWVVDYKNEMGHMLTLELYRHGENLKAFGIYSEERPQGVKLHSIGAQGFVESGSIFFLADEYYVKVYNGRPEVFDDDFIEFAQSVAQKVCKHCSLPQEFNLFPIEGKMEHSERYMPQNFMGLSGFNGVCTVKYMDSGETLRLFAFKGSDEKCRAIMEKYFNRVKYKKKLKEKFYVFDDPYIGMVKIAYKEGYVYGMLDSSNPENHFKLFQTFSLLIE